MTTGTFTAAELVALDAADLAELLRDVLPSLVPGETLHDYPAEQLAVRAAALGLDLAVPAHRAAVDAAIRCQGGPDTPVSAAQEGVRSDLTPDPPAPADAPTEPQPAPSDGTEPLSAASMAELIDRYRGTSQPFAAGTFALYAAPDGSVVLVTEMPSRGIERNVMPAKLVRLALGFASGRGPASGMLGRMFGA